MADYSMRDSGPGGQGLGCRDGSTLFAQGPLSSQLQRLNFSINSFYNYDSVSYETFLKCIIILYENGEQIANKILNCKDHLKKWKSLRIGCSLISHYAKQKNGERQLACETR